MNATLESSIQPSIKNQIRSRFGPGTVFSSADFKGQCSRVVLDQTLSRLNASGDIVRIINGLYYQPKISSYSQKLLPPHPEQVVQAIARKTKSRIMPSGAIVANQLGLSDQVPVVYEYLTEGRSRNLKIGALRIKLRRTSKEVMKLSGTIMGDVFLALRFIGKNQVNAQYVRTRLSQTLSEVEKKRLDEWSDQGPKWMRSIITNLP